MKQFTPFYSNKFKKELNKVRKNKIKNFDSKFKFIHETLLFRSKENQQLSISMFYDHKLHGNFVGTRELHIFPDLLLIYRVNKKNSEIQFLRIGSHSELFN